jgi:hypothetical protein
MSSVIEVADEALPLLFTQQRERSNATGWIGCDGLE